MSSCPTNGTTVTCLIDTKYCLIGSIAAPSNYSTFEVLGYCIPDPDINGKSITQYFDYSIIASWIFDIRDGYLIIIGSAVAGIIITLVYLCLLRCLTTCILFTSLVIIELVLIGIGILLILEAANVQIVDTLPINLADLSQL